MVLEWVDAWRAFYLYARFVDYPFLLGDFRRRYRVSLRALLTEEEQLEEHSGDAACYYS